RYDIRVTEKDARKRIDALRDELARANRAYYVESSPFLTDREFDERLAELASLEAKFPQFDDPNSPTRRVGEEATGRSPTVRHAAPMLSIDNTSSPDEVRAWVVRVAKQAGTPLARVGHDESLFEAAEDAPGAGDSLRFVCDPKIDG